MIIDPPSPKDLQVIDEARKRFVLAGETEEDRAFRRYQVYPEHFIREVLGVNESNGLFITGQQLELIENTGRLSFCKKLKWDFEKAGKLQELPRAIRRFSQYLGITIRAGRGVGKSCSSSWLTFWFLSTHNNSKVPCVGPTEKSLKTILWAELNMWYRKVDSNGEGLFQEPFKSAIDIRASEIRVNGDPQWTAFQRVSPRNADEGILKAVLGGQHADNMMIIIDEANSLQDAVFEPLESTMTSRCNFVIALFNPTRHNGWAYDSHYDLTKSQHFIKLHWSGEDSALVSQDYVESLAKKYGGRENNNFRVSVLGVPPSSEDNSLISYTWVENAIRREPMPNMVNERTVIFGVDVARSGGDNTVVCVRKGYDVRHFITINKIDSIDVAIDILKLAKDYNPEYICIDSLGVGAGVYDALRRSFPKVYAVEFSRSSNKPQFRVLRDELWYRLRELFEKQPVTIPDLEPLRIQLSTVRFEDNMGIIKIEAKKDIKKRLGGDSPDYADALAISMYVDDLDKNIIKEDDLMDPYDKLFRDGFNKQMSGRNSWMGV